MRVIAGSARRTPLAAPAGVHTRPTADRAKEALFSILGTGVVGARFLDLFCGSGAVGIEALSRGGHSAVFVDNDKRALTALEANLAATKLAGRATVMPGDACRAMAAMHREGRVFDFIFLDPPYEGDAAADALTQLASAPIIAEDGLVIVETDARLPALAVRFAPGRQRDYGRTRFMFFNAQEFYT